MAVLGKSVIFCLILSQLTSLGLAVPLTTESTSFSERVSSAKTESTISSVTNSSTTSGVTPPELNVEPTKGSNETEFNSESTEDSNSTETSTIRNIRGTNGTSGRGAGLMHKYISMDLPPVNPRENATEEETTVYATETGTSGTVTPKIPHGIELPTASVSSGAAETTTLNPAHTNETTTANVPPNIVVVTGSEIPSSSGETKTYNVVTETQLNQTTTVAS